MSKNIFNVLGVLIAAALFVSIAVGGVSAYTIAADDKLNINIVDGSLVLTEDVATWPNPVTGSFVSAETAYGALRTAYATNNVAYTGTGSLDDGSYYLTSVNGVSESEEFFWLAYVNGVLTSDLTTSISDNDEVAFILTNVEANNYVTIANDAVLDAIAFVVDVTPVNVIYDSTFAGNGMTAQAVLQALAAQGAFTVSISDPTEAYPYAWLNNVNGISKDWTKTGYGFAILLKEAGSDSFVSTDALNAFTVETGDVLRIWMAPSVDGGASTLPVTGATQWGGGYYLDGATDKVTITIA